MSRGLFGLACLCVLGLAAFLGSGAPSAGAVEACPNQALRTGAAASLPDCRAYELVSPPAKNGGELMPSSMKTRISADGDATVFASLSAFGDAEGTGIETYYASVRGEGGWNTHSLMPKQQPQPYGTAVQSITPTYDEFSEDLTRGVFFAISPLTDAPNVAAANNLYLRDDVLTPGGGSYSLLTDSIPPQDPDNDRRIRPSVFAASDDWSQFLFQSLLDLVPEATPCHSGPGDCTPKLYEWDNGVVRLAGILPNGQPSTCPGAGDQVCSAPDSPQSYIGPSAMSDDGSRVFFNAPVTVGGTPQAGFGSQVYMRQNHASTVRINASESDTPDPNGPLEAAFWGATPDGSKAFFITPENLTNDATGNGANLYMYDASRPDSAPDNLTLVSRDEEPSDGLFAAAQGVIGFSNDGSYVYFVSKRQLVPGGPTEPSLSDRIYVWHDGGIRYLGAFPDTLNGLTNTDGIEAAGREDASLVVRTSRVTPDGRHLLFTAHDGSELLGDDHGECIDSFGLPSPCSEVYLYDYDGAEGAGELGCASCNSSGASATANASPFAEVGRSNSRSTNYRNHSISADGQRVFFTSGEALVPADDNGKKDAYEYDAETGEHHLLSSGKSSEDSYFLDATPDGDSALIATREQLVGIDDDPAFDLYSVRVGGGIASQSPPPAPAECAGDPCQGAGSGAAAVPPAPPSSTWSGRGNGAAREPVGGRRCPKGQHRAKAKAKARCVKKKRANSHRRASR